jgi:cbb3-type cytochrome oxidase cytochrome c subunit
MILRIKIDRLTLHPDLQMREVMDQALIYSYVQLMKEGAVFDPMSATFDGNTYWLDGGHHRYQAYKLLNVREVAVDYTDGDFDHAFKKALKSNHKNGKQRSNDDKRKAVLKCFLRYPDMSNYEVAKECEVSQPFVAGVRDPEVKSRQDEAREKSVEKKLKADCGEKTTNPISSENTTLEESQALGIAPSDDEMEAAAAAMEANEAAWMRFLEADDKLAEAFEEIKNLNLLVAQLRLRMNGLMNEKNLAIKIIKELEADKKSLMKKLKKPT